MERKIFAFGSIIVGPVLLAACHSADTKTNTTPPAANTDIAPATVALDIRNCITTVLPRTPDKNNPYCQDLLQIIASLSKIKTIQGCDGLTTILDTPPTPAQIDTLRNCASAAFVAQKPL